MTMKPFCLSAVAVGQLESFLCLCKAVIESYSYMGDSIQVVYVELLVNKPLLNVM